MVHRLHGVCFNHCFAAVVVVAFVDGIFAILYVVIVIAAVIVIIAGAIVVVSTADSVVPQIINEIVVVVPTYVGAVISGINSIESLAVVVAVIVVLERVVIYCGVSASLVVVLCYCCY